MNQPDSIPPFAAWVDYCFKDGYAAFHGHKKEKREMLDIAPVPLAEYLAQLFENPESLIESYTEDELADGIWFACGVGSEFFLRACADPVPKLLQIRWVSALSNLYTRVFDRVCNQRNSTSDDLSNSTKLDVAVYMLWDMGCLYSAAAESEQEHLIDPIFSVLQTALDCRTCSCIKSGLHGLGHLHDYHPTRVEKMIDAFLITRPDLPVWLQEYATAARSGAVQ